MLPNEITLTLGPGNTARVFSIAKRANTETLYYAPSPNGDLAGRPSLRISHETTKGGIVRSLVSFKIPEYNELTGKYSNGVTSNHVVIRSGTSALVDVDLAMECTQEVLAVTDFRSDVGNAEN